jgi:DNA-directed RNA polymerase specialized sigma24 family protein
MVTPRDAIDAVLCEGLARRAVGGDDRAWQDLAGHLWAPCLRIVGKSRAMRNFGASQDHVSNVVTNLFGKLRDDGARGLKLYEPWRARNPAKSFDDWLRIVLANAIRDYVRDHAGESPEAERKELSVTRLLNQFTTSGALEEIGERPAMTAAQTARQLLTYAGRHLPEDQCRALMLWIEGSSFEEVGVELGLGDAEAARRQVRAAVAVLRRRFVGEE